MRTNVFHMEALQMAVNSLVVREFVTLLDLKDVYFHVADLPNVRNLLQQWEGVFISGCYRLPLNSTKSVYESS